MLLENCPQKKTFAYFRGHISKGELIHKNESLQWIVAYANPTIFVDCQINQLKFVKPLFIPYLLAVEDLVSRYNLFISNLNSLTKNVSLNVGDQVDVMLEQQVIPAAAIVRYKGNLPGKNSTFFGVEILVSHCTYMYIAILAK